VSDESRALLRQQKRNGEHAIVSGLTQLAMSVPILVIGGLLAVVGSGKYAIVIALITLSLCMAAIGRGTVRMIRGARTAARASRELAALERGQLPEARVVER
jgi:hypothetical protein